MTWGVCGGSSYTYLGVKYRVKWSKNLQNTKKAILERKTEKGVHNIV